MGFLRASEVAVEIAHHGIDGTLHGHTLMVQVWTEQSVDLDAWHDTIAQAVAHLERGPLEDIVGRTFEDLAVRVLERVPGAVRVCVRLPSRGHVIDLSV